MGILVCVKVFLLIIMVKIVNIKMKIFIMIWVMMEIFNILIGLLIGGSCLDIKFRKKIKVSKSVIESDIFFFDDFGWVKINGLIRLRLIIGIKMFKIKNVGFFLKWIVKIVLLLINLEEKVCFDFFFEICVIFYCLLVFDGKINCK